MPTSGHYEGVILGIDIGDSRVGVARAHSISRFPEPVTVLKADDSLTNSLLQIAKSEEAVLLVFGLPVPLNTDENQQTKHIKEVAEHIGDATNLPFVFVDESYSSKLADEYISNNNTSELSNDAIASCIILERYFTEGEL